MLPPEIRALAATMARARNLPPAHVQAIVDVESGGKVFATFADAEGVTRNYPLILFEPHLMYRRTEGAVRDRLVALGLASRAPNRALYGKTQSARWAQMKRAAEIAGDVAYECASYGVGQVLGQHWQALGFPSLQAFIKRMVSGAEGQIDIMLKYIETNDLDDELRDGRWPAFFRGYNGPAWEKGGYGKKIEAALRLYGGASEPADGMLRMGSKGARVRELQALLLRAGHQVRVDGDFGPSTKSALKAFQRTHGLAVDGVYGPKTERALGEFRQGSADRPGREKAVDIDAVKQGAGGVAGGVGLETLQGRIDDATGQLQTVDGFQPWLGYGLAALSLLALALAAWGAWRAISGWLASRKTVEV